MRSLRLNLPAYRQLAGMWIQVLYTYRAGIVLDLVSLLLQVFLLRLVWTALYAGRDVAGGLHLHPLITMLTLANLQLWVMYPHVATFLQERIRDGRVALDLARPVGFIDQLLAQQAGATAGMLPLVALAFPFALLLGGMEPPASATAAALYAISLIMAYLVTVLIGLLLGLIAFWTLEMSGFVTIYRFVSQFFSGALVPLQLLPAPLFLVAGALPFQAQAAIPLSLYLGLTTGADAAKALALQGFWVVALYLLAQLIWKLAIRRVVIQGG